MFIAKVKVMYRKIQQIREESRKGRHEWQLHAKTLSEVMGTNLYLPRCSIITKVGGIIK